jgi:hypothetical protein
VQLFLGGSVQPMMAGAAIVDDRPNRQYICMFYDEAKRVIFAQPLKGTAAVALDTIAGAPTQCMLLETQPSGAVRTWRLAFRTPADAFGFVSMFCVANGLGAAAAAQQPLVSTVRFDARKVDKKQKSCKPEHYALVRYRWWQLDADALDKFRPEFDPEDAASGVVGEVKIGTGGDGDSETLTVAPASLAEQLTSMRVGAQKLHIMPRCGSRFWESRSQRRVHLKLIFIPSSQFLTVRARARGRPSSTLTCRAPTSTNRCACCLSN